MLLNEKIWLKIFKKKMDTFKNPFHNGSLKTDPCPYLLKYSPGVLKKK